MQRSQRQISDSMQENRRSMIEVKQSAHAVMRALYHTCNGGWRMVTKECGTASTPGYLIGSGHSAQPFCGESPNRSPI